MPETYETSGIRCPYCQYLDRDDLYYEEGCHEIECPSCGEEFNLTVNVSYSYTAYEKDSEV